MTHGFTRWSALFAAPHQLPAELQLIVVSQILNMQNI
jgi:hypothetical protein